MNEYVISEKVDNYFGKRILDLTRGVSFSTKMDSHLEKKSNEAQALAVCRLIMGDVSRGLKRGDAPDLQNVEKRLGIEVVSSHSETYRRVETLEWKYREELKKKKNNAQKIKSEIEKNDGFKVLGNQVSYPMNPTDEKNVLLKNILKKSAKIKEYRLNGFDRMGLFVWLLSSIVTELITETAPELEMFLKEAKPFFIDSFDFVIIQRSYQTIAFNSNFDLIGTYRIPEEYYIRLPYLGRMVAEGMIKDEDLFGDDA